VGYPSNLNGFILKIVWFIIFDRYYSDLEKKRCPEVSPSVLLNMNGTNDPNACIVWRRFSKSVTIQYLSVSVLIFNIFP